MGKHCIVWWSLFYIAYFILLGNGGVGKGLTLAMKGHPYYTEEAIIKTFKFDGDVVDCVDIYKQPAFDHTLLKNHTIQMKPSFVPRSSMKYSNATTVNGSTVEDTHPWLFTKGCPKGSIPITKMPYMNRLVRNNATASYSHIYYPRYLRDHDGTKDNNVQDNGHEYAALQIFGDKLYGASANFDVYHPMLEDQREFSLSQISVSSYDFTTTLGAGWMVYPVVYGDDKTRFFTFWTNHDHQASCYNLRCPGFVWTNHAIRVGTKLKPYSIVGGPQHDVKIEIFQDGNHGTWWVSLDGNLVGYWLKSIVPKLGDGAHLLNFGGEILNKKKTGAHTSTQMGSGHYATEGHGKSASIKHVKVAKARDRSKYTAPDVFEKMVSHPTCYNLEVGHDLGLSWEFYFYYGGAGRSATCP